MLGKSSKETCFSLAILTINKNSLENLMITISVISQLTANHEFFGLFGYCYHMAPALLPWKQVISLLKIAELETHDVRLKRFMSRYEPV